MLTAATGDKFYSDGIYYRALSSTTCEVFRPNYVSGDITIPASVTDGATNTTYTVTSVGQEAFWGQEGITSFSLPSTLTLINRNAFNGCTGISAITIPDGVETIHNSAFYNCTKLSSISMPSALTTIGDDTFAYCSALKTVTFNNKLQSIGARAFEKCTALTEASLPASLLTIGESAFSNCIAMRSVTIPNGLVSMGDNVFRACASLFSVTLPSTLMTISSSTFEECSILTTVTVPDGLTTIGNNAFKDCSALTGFVIPSTVTSIGDYAFCGCSNLTTATIPDGVTEVGASVFSGCSALASVTLPPSITKIGAEAFMSCSALTEITIPANTATIGQRAFSLATKLAKITSYRVEAPSILEYTFEAVSPTSCKLYVSTLSQDIYAVADYWSNFTNIYPILQITGLDIDRSELSLAVGEEADIIATYQPAYADALQVQWTSSNPRVATVDDYGHVTAIADGTITITAASRDNAMISRTCTVVCGTGIGGVDDIAGADDTAHIAIVGRTLSIDGATPYAAISLVRPDGATAAIATAAADGSATITAPAPGFYIVAGLATPAKVILK